MTFAGVEPILRLIFAMVVGGLVGFERELHDRPAGLRTHILVCVGASLLMMISVEVSRSYVGVMQSDPARIAAQVVSGIGFLGAGTILREGATVRGLTTAAGLWMAAALGLASGAGLYSHALGATAIALISLSLLSRVELYVALKRSTGIIRLMSQDRPGLLGSVGALVGSHGVNITNIRMTREDGDQIELLMLVGFSPQSDKLVLVGDLEAIEGVTHAEIRGRDLQGPDQ